jgi:hypothetical protein
VPRLCLRSNDGGSLTVDAESPRDPWHWRVIVESAGLTAAADIDPDLMRYGMIDRLDAYFAALASDWRGWSGARDWGQLPFVLSASMTASATLLCVPISPTGALQTARVKSRGVV